MKEIFAEQYFKTKSSIFIARAHFHGDAARLLLNKNALLTLKKFVILHVFFNPISRAFSRYKIPGWGGGGEGGVTKNHTSENPLLIVKLFEIWFE